MRTKIASNFQSLSNVQCKQCHVSVPKRPVIIKTTRQDKQKNKKHLHPKLNV